MVDVKEIMWGLESDLRTIKKKQKNAKTKTKESYYRGQANYIKKVLRQMNIADLQASGDLPYL